MTVIFGTVYYVKIIKLLAFCPFNYLLQQRIQSGGNSGFLAAVKHWYIPATSKNVQFQHPIRHKKMADLCFQTHVELSPLSLSVGCDIPHWAGITPVQHMHTAITKVLPRATMWQSVPTSNQTE